MSELSVKKDAIQNMYKRLDIQLSKYWLDKHDYATRSQKSFLFSNALRAIENFVLDIEHGQILNLAKYQNLVERNDKVKIQETHDYFNQLLHDPEWFSYWRITSTRVDVFFSAIRTIKTANAEAELKAQMINALFVLDVAPTMNQGDKKIIKSSNLEMAEEDILESTSSFDFERHSDFLFQLIDHIASRLKQPKFIQNTLAQKILSDDLKHDALAYVEECFGVSSSLNVLCMDFGTSSTVINQKLEPLVGREKLKNNIEFQKARESLLSQWNRFILALNQIHDLIGNFAIIEFNVYRGLSIHCVFLCRPVKNRSDSEWVSLIGDLWCQAMTHGQAYHNCNPEIIKLSKHAVGMIKKADFSAFEHWVIDHITLSLQHLSVRSHHGKPLFLINQEKPKLARLHQQTPVAQDQKDTPPDPFSTLTLSEKARQAIWTVTTDQLAVKYVDAINAASIIYREVPLSSPCFDIQTPIALQIESRADLLIKIETLITLIRGNHQPAFEVSRRSSVTMIDTLNATDIKKSMTRIGQQLIDLDSRYGLADIGSFLAADLKSLSISINIFCKIALDTKAKWQLQVKEMSATTHSKCNFYNGFVTQIRELLKDSLKALPEIQRRRERLSAPSKKDDSSKTVHALILDQHRIATQDFIKVSQEVAGLFIKDSILIGLRFYINQGTSDIPHDVFSALFTTFMSLGRKCYPMSRVMGYIGRWEFVEEKQRCAHVILITDSNISGVDDTVQQIADYWANTLKDQKKVGEYLKKLSIDYLAGTLTRTPIFKSHPDFNDFYCKIEHKNKKKQKAFIQHVVCYLTQSELYVQPNLQWFPKSLIKSSKAKIPSDTPTIIRRRKMPEAQGTIVVLDHPNEPHDLQTQEILSNEVVDHGIAKDQLLESQTAAVDEQIQDFAVLTSIQDQGLGVSLNAPLDESLNESVLTEQAETSNQTVPSPQPKLSPTRQAMLQKGQAVRLNKQKKVSKPTVQISLDAEPKPSIIEDLTIDPMKSILPLAPVGQALISDAVAEQDSKIADEIVPNTQPLTKRQQETADKIAFAKKQRSSSHE